MSTPHDDEGSARLYALAQSLQTASDPTVSMLAKWLVFYMDSSRKAWEGWQRSLDNLDPRKDNRGHSSVKA